MPRGRSARHSRVPVLVIVVVAMLVVVPIAIVLVAPISFLSTITIPIVFMAWRNDAAGRHQKKSRNRAVGGESFQRLHIIHSCIET